IKHRLHALVLEGAATKNRYELASNRAFADELLQRLLVGLVTLKVGFHRGVVHFDGRLDQLRAILFSLVLQISSDFPGFKLGTKRLVLPDEFLHLNEIDETLELRFSANRKLQHQ